MAIRFNANSERLERTASAWNHNADYAVAFRFRLTSGIGTSRHYLFEIDGGTAGADADWIYVDTDARLHMRRTYTGGASDFNVVGATAIVADTDYDVCVVASGTTLSVYLNDVLECTATLRTARAAATRFAFGDIGGGSGGDAQYVHGSMSDLGAWTEALDATARATVRADSCAGYTTNAWGRWTADTETAITDQSGNGRDLTAVGTLDNVADPVVPSGGTPLPTSAQLDAPVARNKYARALAGKVFTYATDDVGVATVSDAGLVGSVAAGTANVRASCEGIDSNACAVTVT